ncbi:unnamed protein product [Pleuronectes platessa]|uniref:Uncharacterized protein n=1 Tax=Pleuronectes platessa TaxID=8262 RepID=A0A9N7VNV2_PLEPL|nr:unnamed protein product [Pleuronectes platessa]
MWSPSQPDKDPLFSRLSWLQAAGGLGGDTVGALGRSMGPYGPRRSISEHFECAANAHNFSDDAGILSIIRIQTTNQMGHAGTCNLGWPCSLEPLAALPLASSSASSSSLSSSSFPSIHPAFPSLQQPRQ